MRDDQPEQLKDKRHFPKPGPFETYLGKAQEFVAGRNGFLR